MAARNVKCKVCDNKPQTRGLCHTHRYDAKAVIDAGIATDADLVAAGLMAPKELLGRKPAKRRKKTAPVSLEGNLILQRLQELSLVAK
jgi:hypothetical protein